MKMSNIDIRQYRYHYRYLNKPGISTSIDDSALAETVINLFAKVNASVNAYSSNVEDCHCLMSMNNGPQKVVKLPKQKDVYRV